ncbi:hypothetical protein FRC09_015287, partial [Ceratobasidium sp. 395]
MECLGYTYLDNPEELIQARAKIASRTSAGRSIHSTSGFDAQNQSITSFPVGAGPSDSVGRSPYIVRSHSVPSGLPSSSSAGYDTDFAGTSPTVDNLRPNVPNFLLSPQFASPGSLGNTNSRESELWGNNRNASTFRGDVPHEGFASQPQSATQANLHRTPGSVNQNIFEDVNGFIRQYPGYGGSFAGDVPESRVSSPSLSDDALYDCDSESTDRSERDNITEIVCGVPSGAEREDNALPYVLQCYTDWMMETALDPLRMAHLMRNHIVERFMASEESRTTVISIANVVRCMGTPLLPSNQILDTIGTLHSRVQQMIIVFNAHEPHIYEQGTHIATKTLGYAIEILPVHLAMSSLSTSVSLLRDVTLAFRRVVPERTGLPINLPGKLASSHSDVRQYAALDVMMSLGTGCPMSFQYDVSYTSPPFGGSDVFNVGDALGLQWMQGCPVEFVLLLARMHNIRDNPAYAVEPPELDEIENAIRDWHPRFSLPVESHLAIVRLTLCECWRQSLLIYLFMGIGALGSGDVRVTRAHKSFMKLIKVVHPGRVPDYFLLLPFLVAAVASHKQKDRNRIYERIRAIRE